MINYQILFFVIYYVFLQNFILSRYIYFIFVIILYMKKNLFYKFLVYYGKDGVLEGKFFD